MYINFYFLNKLLPQTQVLDPPQNYLMSWIYIVLRWIYLIYCIASALCLLLRWVIFGKWWLYCAM